MKEDNEMLDSAIDEALNAVEERSKSSEQEASTKKAETHDEPVGDESADETNEAEAQEETDLDQEASAENNQDEGQAIPEPETTVDAPAFWSAEEKAAFAKADPALRDIIKRRELAAQQHISRLNNEAKNGKGYEQRFYSDFESPEAANLHKAKLYAQGINDPIAELHRYRAWDKVLTSDPHAVISDLMRKNGFTPYDFTNEANYEPENQYQDPRVDEALRRAEAAEKAFQDFKAQQDQAKLAEVVNTYKSGKFDDGQPRERFMAIYAPQIDQAFMALGKNPNYQHLNDADRLHHATEYVRGQVNELHGIKSGVKKELPQKTREQIIQESKKAQAAASATTGAPNTASISASKRPRLRGKTDGERVGSAIDIALDRAYGMQ